MEENKQEETVTPEVEVLEEEAPEAVDPTKEWEQRYIRLQADFENFRRRTNQEKEQLGVFVKSHVIEDLLPVLDNFERALSVPETPETKAFMDGFVMIQQSLMASLSKQGLAVIEAVGQPFDPNFHQAIMRVPAEDMEDDTVCEVLQTGYTVEGRVVRPAMVKVVHNG